jgi:putative phosphoesterase
MKLMIASDIHGSAKFCQMMKDRFTDEKADMLLLLGDYLYHGPRNDLPDGYEPKLTASILNSIKENILSVRGNCEAEVDQLMLEFPVMADYGFVYADGRYIYLTHGHHYNEENPIPGPSGYLLLCGHTHIPKFEKHDTFIFANPGSVSIPKSGPHSYMILENNTLSWKDLTDSSSYMTRTI